MNTRPHATGTEADPAAARFDQVIRQHHANAVERISPRARAQLAQRRSAALRGEVQPRPAFGLRHAGFAFAAVFAVAVGIGLMPATQTPAPAPMPQVAATTPATSNTILDEDPDFYAWLASTEVQQLAME